MQNIACFFLLNHEKWYIQTKIVPLVQDLNWNEKGHIL